MPRLDVVLKDLGELEMRVGVTHALKALPALRLGSLDEAHECGNVDASSWERRITPVNYLPVLSVDAEQRLLVGTLKVAAFG